eukprot:TRINITY_DN73065_c0_g1_i1.p1 TRINITY_DN73065_c0_g1~~TRINITY_DN73065_c0_g1_i1.p1  ORF type:complete len:746 (-),score=156.10 TRINITY_DN73065_c0_g1_i1:419-2656(-)
MAERMHGCVRVLTETNQAASNALKAEKLSVFLGSRCLLADTELKIAENHRYVQVESDGGTARTVKAGTSYGLVGVNGCGKSTLLKLIADRQLLVPPSWDVFMVGQHLAEPKDRTALEEVLAAHQGRAELLQKQEGLEAELGAQNDTAAFVALESQLRAVCTELCGLEGSEQEVTSILVALGFRVFDTHDQDSTPSVHARVNELSGGWRMKLELAKALWLQPKLLLLDEPSNHLDFQALQWLQEKIEEYPHTAVIVSHDVNLLHCTCQEILWIKDQRIESLPRDIVSPEDLLRMQRSRALKFQFSVPKGEDPLAHGISLHGIEFRYPSSSSSSPCFRVKGNVRFSGKTRAVLLGKNGSGKSTFLDLCVGKLEPSRGSIDRTPDLKIGHYSQLTDELDRCSQVTAAGFLVQQCSEELSTSIASNRGSRLQASLARAVGKNPPGRQTDDDPCSKRSEGAKAAKTSVNDKKLLEKARAVLNQYGFDGDEAVTVPVDRLSGGQKACLKFAVLSLRPVHILLLDEPTNHLDAETCQALAKGLAEFQGGVVAVTHDETMIYRLIHCNWTASELLLCRDGCLRHEKNFSAQCLRTLIDDVRRAEEIEKAAGRFESKKKAHQGNSAAASASSVTSSGAAPPWLLGRARPTKSKQVAGKDGVVAETMLSDKALISFAKQSANEDEVVAVVSAAAFAAGEDEVVAEKTLPSPPLRTEHLHTESSVLRANVDSWANPHAGAVANRGSQIQCPCWKCH